MAAPPPTLPKPRSQPGCANFNWASALLRGLVAGGVRALVLSPGSRSTPMVLAAQRLSEQADPHLRLLPVLDERSAAFLALGLALQSRRPVAVLATSGSAPGHWLPAVMEAHASGVPLVLLSADRPPRLRHWGANQTLDQTRLFGSFALEFHDPGLPSTDPRALKAMQALGRRCASVSTGPAPGPVHINLPFDEPLVAVGECPSAAAPTPMEALPSATTTPTDYARVFANWPTGRGLLLCGPAPVDPALVDACNRLMQRSALPVLADPLSGLRFSADADASNRGGLINRYDSLLRNAAAARSLRPDWVLRFGAAPVSKGVLEWLAGVPSVQVDTAGRWSDPTHDGIAHIHASPASFCDALADSGVITADGDWLAQWQTAETAVAELERDYLSKSAWFEGHLVRDLLATLPAEEALLCANSLPIRHMDWWSGNGATPLTIYCNRGVSGIDGQLSTLAGLNAGGTPTWALLGDLSFLHDFGGLLQCRHLTRPIIVINNGGGRIFDYLPQHDLPDIETLWRTPQAVAPGMAGKLFGLPHATVRDGDDFRRALVEHGTHAALIEVIIDADASRTTQQGFWRRVESAILLPP